jgi:hypothetical protein
MIRLFGKSGTALIGFGIFAIWFIVQFWYVTLPIITITIICYVLICKSNKKENQTSSYNKKTSNYYQEKQQRLWQDYERKKQEVHDKFTKEREERIEQEKLHHEQQEKNNFEENEKRVKERLEQFKLSETEALLVFGKNWRKRLGKPNYEFVTEELVNRIVYKICEDDDYKRKISSIMEKVLDLIGYYIKWYGKHEGWDDLKFEDWEEDWADVKETWSRLKWHYQNKTYSNNKRKYQSRYDSDFSDKDYYKILGVSQNATIDEIKKQYRELIMKFHPDRNKSPESEKKCQAIIEAYENLVNV